MTSDAIDAALKQIREALDALAPLRDGPAGSPDAPATVAAMPDDEGLLARIARLEGQLAARDEFIAAVAHELRSPILPILMHTRTMTARLSDTAPTEPVTPQWTLSQLRRLERQVERVLEALDRLVDLSRLSSGRIDLRLEEIDVCEVVHDVIAAHEPELALSKCEVRFEHHEPVVGRWDRRRLEQVCEHLLSNAIKNCAGRPIDIRVDGNESFAVLTVRDYGVGIDRRHQQRLFERFDRSDIDKRGGGFGVGLWVVKSICLALGGTVSVESELGRGATFVVMLPRRRSDRLNRRTDGPPSSPAGTWRTGPGD